jgi:hypothetical protein
MKKTTTIVKSVLYRMCVAIGVAALCSGIPNVANATQTIRELFDSLPGHPVSDGLTLDGLTNDFTSVGLSTGFWTNNPPGSTGIGYKDSFTVNWVMQALQGNILPDSGTGANGCIDQYTGNLNTLIDPNTGNPYGVDSPQIYSTHPLDPSAYVNCNAAGTYYFSVRVVKNYSWNTGDSSVGFGLSTGNQPTDHFIGFGATRPNATATNGADIGDTDYVTQGTLGQAGLTGEPDTGGPYLPLATGAAQLFNSGVGAVNWAEAGLLVGKLVTLPGGACTLSVFTILPNATIVSNETDVVWDATYSFTETSTMTQLLIWMHGNNVEFDAVRVGTSYSDIIGLETIGAPVASPAATEYAGTTVTLTGNAQVNSGLFPMTYQWLSNSVPWDLTQTNVSLVLTNTTVNMTANYSLVVSNYYGMITTAVTHVTFLPTTPAYITAQPVSVTRYVGSPVGETFTVGANGTPPYNYQWKHAGTNFQLHVTSSLSDTLAVPGPTTVADGGNYSVTISNGYGSPTNSAVVANNVLVPTTGSFAAAVTALNPWGYWRLDDNVLGTSDPTIYDDWGNNNGAAVDTNTPTFDAVASTYIGFPQPHKGIRVGNDANSDPCKINLPKIVWTNQMTIAFWVNNAGAQMCTMNAYGNGYGLRNESGELVFNWASLGAPSGGGGLDTGLALTDTNWTFVAMVVSTNEAILYMGTNNSLLVSSDMTGLDLPTSDAAGDTAGNYPPGLGRIEWPYSEDGAGFGYNTMTGTWSDVVIFNYVLSPSAITNLYLSGVGQAIYAAPDGLGNLIMQWNPAFTLQQANAVTGPWADVGGTPTPPYSVPITSGIKFYRVRQ